MLPLPLLAFTAGLLLPLIAAFSTPACVPSTVGYQVKTLNTLNKTFRRDIANGGFNSGQEVAGVHVISLSVISATGNASCELNNCLTEYGSLTQSCSMTNHSMWRIDADCGTYNSNLLEPATHKIWTSSATGTQVLLNLRSDTQTTSSMSTGKTTALGTSDAGIIQAGGITLIGVAFIFTWFL